MWTVWQTSFASVARAGRRKALCCCVTNATAGGIQPALGFKVSRKATGTAPIASKRLVGLATSLGHREAVRQGGAQTADRLHHHHPVLPNHMLDITIMIKVIQIIKNVPNSPFYPNSSGCSASSKSSSRTSFRADSVVLESAALFRPSRPRQILAVCHQRIESATARL